MATETIYTEDTIYIDLDELEAFLDQYPKMGGLDPELIYGVGIDKGDQTAYIRYSALKELVAGYRQYLSEVL